MVYVDEGMTIPQYGYVKKNTYSELHINALANAYLEAQINPLLNRLIPFWEILWTKPCVQISFLDKSTEAAPFMGLKKTVPQNVLIDNHCPL